MRRILTLAALGALAGTLFTADVASAQNARSGFWFNGGLGYGSLGCEDCPQREGGVSGNLTLGGTISPRLLLGVSSNGWTKEEAGGRLTAGTLTALARFYPSERGAFFLNGGIGVGTLEASLSGFGSASETGGGALLGLGYDVRVAPNVSVTPYWNAVGISLEGGNVNFAQLGLSITVH